MTEAKLIDYIIILAIPALLMYARKNKNNIKLNLIAFAIMVVLFSYEFARINDYDTIVIVIVACFILFLFLLFGIGYLFKFMIKILPNIGKKYEIKPLMIFNSILGAIFLFPTIMMVKEKENILQGIEEMWLALLILGGWTIIPLLFAFKKTFEYTIACFLDNPTPDEFCNIVNEYIMPSWADNEIKSYINKHPERKEDIIKTINRMEEKYSEYIEPYYICGIMYEKGYYVQKNTKTAYEYYNKALSKNLDFGFGPIFITEKNNVQEEREYNRPDIKEFLKEDIGEKIKNLSGINSL